MRAKLLVLLLLGSVTLLAFATPTAGAVGWCTAATDPIKDPDCPHVFCLGMSGSPGNMRCQYYVPWPCQYCTPLRP